MNWLAHPVGGPSGPTGIPGNDRSGLVFNSRMAGQVLLRITVLIALCSVFAGCATSQPVREHHPGDAPVAGTDEDELWYAMQRAEADLQRSPQLVRDPALNDYVRKIACDVADDYCRDLRVYIVDLPEFHAWMAPNALWLL